MPTQIAITHLTRMQEGYICAAGVDLATGRHLRPVLDHRLSDNYLRCHGGIFDMALVLEFDGLIPMPHAPRMEDHLFKPNAVRLTRCLNRREFWTTIQSPAKPKLADLFGRELRRRGESSAGVDIGKGIASLGCLIPHGRPTLSIRERPGKSPSIRMALSDGVFNLDAAVTDVRLYGPDHVTPDQTAMENVTARLNAGVRLILGVGLGHAPPPRPNAPAPCHWLQVNNLHLEDRPIWQVA